MRDEQLCGTSNEKTRYFAKQHVTAFADWIAANLGDEFELHPFHD